MGEGIGTGASLSYSYRSDSSIYSADNVTGYGSTDGSGEPWQNNWLPLTPLQKAGIQESLNAWAEVANIRLTEVVDSTTVTGDIRFSTLSGITDSKTYQPEPSFRAGDVWLTTASELNTSSKGTYGYTEFLRETGHALGLENPHEGRVIADSPIDVLPVTVMSHRSFVGDSLDGQYDILYPTTPMLNDIAAMQYLYGANLNTRNDDTTYSWTPDQLIFETIWDGGGDDTIDWSNQSTAATIDLNAGAWSYLGPNRWDGQTSTNKNVAIAYNVIIENATGGSGNDKITGNSANNFLNGGDGNDELRGGAGADIFDWNETSREGDDTMFGGSGNDTYVINSPSDTIVELSDEGIDLVWTDRTFSLADIANVEGIFLFGIEPIDAIGNTLANTLKGNDNNNSLFGDEGNDLLIGGAGNDLLDGGPGTDMAIYLATKDNYFITTTNPSWEIVSSNGDIDTLSNIERLQFLDINIAYDLDGNAGKVAEIIGAVFGVDSLDRKDYVGIGLNLLENGITYSELMKLALDTKLGGGFSDVDEISLLYQNLLGSKPSDPDLIFWTNTLSSGQFTQTSLAIMAAKTDINTTNIDLVGLAQTGIEFI